MIKDVLYKRSAEADVFPEHMSKKGGEMESASDLCSAGKEVGIVCSDPNLADQLKELELALKKQEHETQLLRSRALVIETEWDIQLRRLELEIHILRNQPYLMTHSRLEELHLLSLTLVNM